MTDEEFDQYLKDIGFGDKPEAETIRELYPPVTSDQLTEAEITRVTNLQIMPRNDLPSFVLHREKGIFKVYVADLVEDHELGNDLCKFLVSLEPRVSELVEGETVNDGQKVSIVNRAIVEGISYSIEVVDEEQKITTTVIYKTVWLRSKTAPVINKNDISEMHYVDNSQGNQRT